MNNHLLFATSNLHKLREVRSMMNGYTIDGLDSIPLSGGIPETHETILENAIEKVVFISDFTNRPVFAEDSGLIVESLNGAPGVHSARYAGPEKSDQKNIDKLLTELKNSKNRKAYFHTVIAFMDSKGEVHTFDGSVYGHIATEQRGKKGFGYDPIFIPEGYNLTFGELSTDIKNNISHRRRAMEKFREFLRHNK